MAIGVRVTAPELETGDDASIASFYSGRVTDCSFLSDSRHYEHPRVRWIIELVSGGRLLEVGCGNGGMTALLSPSVEHLVAMTSRPSHFRRLMHSGFGTSRRSRHCRAF